MGARKGRSSSAAQKAQLPSLPDLGSLQADDRPPITSPPAVATGQYGPGQALSEPGGFSLASNWHGADNSPRSAVLQGMLSAGHSPSEPAGQAASFSLLDKLLGGRRLPPVAASVQPTSTFGNGIISYTPGRSQDPYQTLRHETEHAMQAPYVGAAQASEIGPSLGDVIHAGTVWSAVDPSASAFRVPLTPSYQPTVGFMTSQAQRYGYPQNTMDDLLSTPAGKQWLKMRAREFSQ